MRKVDADRIAKVMAQLEKGGVIMDVVNAEQAKIAEAAEIGRASWRERV